MQEFNSLESFYLDNEDRRHSPEADFGVWWKGAGKFFGPSWRISFVRDTGEVIAVNRNDAHEPVVVLGTAPVDDVPEGSWTSNWYDTFEKTIIEDWAEIMPDVTFDWVTERLGATT